MHPNMEKATAISTPATTKQTPLLVVVVLEVLS